MRFLTPSNRPLTDDSETSIRRQPRMLRESAAQFGVPQEQAAGGLAELLPSVIDHLTPNGTIQGDTVEQGLAGLAGKLFR